MNKERRGRKKREREKKEHAKERKRKKEEGRRKIYNVRVSATSSSLFVKNKKIV